MKVVNFQTCPPTLRPSYPTTLIPSIPIKNTIFTIQSKRNNSLFLALCSTKPDTDLGSKTDGDFTAESVLESSECQEVVKNSGLSPAASSSSESSRGLVFDLGIKGSWDSDEIGSPVVKRFLSDDEERWYMWYYGRPTANPDSDSIGIAISSNGIHWERGQEGAASSTGVGQVLSCGEDWWAFDTKSVRPSEVMIMSSTKVRASNAVYWLYYTGFSSEKVELPDLSLEIPLQNPERISNEISTMENCGCGEVFSSLPGLAISQDGRHWAKIEGEHHSGALFGAGSDGEWDSLFIASPHVVFHSSRDIRMYYHSFDHNTKRYAIGIARSRDGLKWVKLGKIMVGGASDGFDTLGAMNACVVRDKKEGSYLMAYEGVGSGAERSIGLAVSLDGLKEWRRLSDGPILKASMEEGWDSKGVGFPCLVQMDGSRDEQWRLYYRGIGDGGRTGIGMAVSDGDDIVRFRRWVGFRL